MRYVFALFFALFMICLGCCGCGGQVRFAYGILEQGKFWSTTTGWTMGMVSTGVVGLAVLGLIAAAVYFNTANVDESAEE